MTEPDVLERSIREHQEWQRAAWQHLSRPSLTIFESRELRNQIKQSGAELRQYLSTRSERFRGRSAFALQAKPEKMPRRLRSSGAEADLTTDESFDEKSQPICRA
jgi:hypothetical protein